MPILWTKSEKEQTMSRYIDADVLVKDLQKRWNVNSDHDFADKEVWRALEEAPTIKTKEIKYFDEDEKIWKIGRVIVDE